MTNEEILKLAFTCGLRKETLTDKCGYDFDAWISTPEELLKFALQVADIEYDRGFDDGWESRADAEQMLAYSKLTDEEPAQDPTNPPVDAL